MSFITLVKLDTTVLKHVCERSILNVIWFNMGNLPIRWAQNNLYVYVNREH